MKGRLAIVFSLILSTVLVTGISHSQTPQPSPPVQPIAATESASPPAPFYQTVWQLELWTWDFWRVVLVSLGSGAFGGLVYHLMNLREIQDSLSQEAKREGRKINPFSRLGYCLSHVSIGAAIAPPAVLLLRPETAFAWVALSIVTGAAGSAVLRNVQEKVMATLSAERAHAEKAKAEQEAIRQAALRFNTQQTTAIKSLFDIARKPNPDPGDWHEIRRIANTLADLSDDCRKTFHPFPLSSPPPNSRSKQAIDATPAYPLPPDTNSTPPTSPK